MTTNLLSLCVGLGLLAGCASESGSANNDTTSDSKETAQNYDPATGLAFDSSRGVYYDPATGFIYDSETGTLRDPETGASYPYMGSLSGDPNTGTPGAESSQTGTKNSPEGGSGTLPAGTDSSSEMPGDDGSRSESAGPPKTVEVFTMTFGGCSFSWEPTLITASNFESISITDSLGLEFLQLKLGAGSTGDVIQLSSPQRSDSGLVINLNSADRTTITNIDVEHDYMGGADGISGTLTINDWQPSAGIMDIEFDAVNLLQLSSSSGCELNGRIKTIGTTY